MSVTRAEQDGTGAYDELSLRLRMQPPPGCGPRAFMLHYDAIMHQVVTHKALVSVRQDWSAGKNGTDGKATEVGIIAVDTRDNSIPELVVNLDEGSAWRGFRGMVVLGIHHISEGTDHLLFLMVLLLAAPLIAHRGQWTESGGTKYTIIRLLKIAPAFTIGHSITLLAGTVGWIRLPSQPVEIMIAVSILITAIHAIRPLFPGKEVYVAAGFGLVHGLAFVTVLSGLQLDGGRMALSILGFNVGIELMQAFVIIMIVPWLIIISEMRAYRWLRTGGAFLSGIVALAWIAERSLNRTNAISSLVQKGQVTVSGRCSRSLATPLSATSGKGGLAGMCGIHGIQLRRFGQRLGISKTRFGVK